jgi:hypothetical protein
VGNLREKVYVVDIGINERIMLKLIFKKCEGTWTVLFWLGIGTRIAVI